MSFKVGDKVRLIEEVTRYEYYCSYGFSGGKGVIYTIDKVSSDMIVHIEGENWCKNKWLVLVQEIYLGGE
ncbi:MAG: hypothetical protein DRQ24_11905 [Candidatus Latescibacterota bacterium]|nr:MAG: hypothetical protein DRQ24_11905 [Candidatus Latescibacterota bacterium]